MNLMSTFAFLIQQDIFVNVFNGFSNAMDRLVMMVILIIVGIDIVLLAMSFRFKNIGLQIAVGITSFFMFLVAIRCIQHSDDFFISGIVLSVLSIIGFIRIYKINSLR